MPILTTERLYVSEILEEDAPFIFALMNAPKWIRYIGDRGIQSINHAKDYIEKTIVHSYTTRGYGFYKLTLKEEDKPIGICGFAKREYLDHTDIGFAILPEYERNGYISEASKAVLTYGDTQLKLQPILGITLRENTVSRHILLKIGLKEIGVVQNPENEELLLFSN